MGMTEQHDTPRSDAPRYRIRPRWLVLIAIGAAVAVAGIAAVLTSVFQRQQEALNPFYRVVALNDTIDDPAVWGKNFPLQYDDYRKTVDQVRTRYGGSEGEPHPPSEADPRTIVAQSRLDERSEERRVGAGWHGGRAR